MRNKRANTTMIIVHCSDSDIKEHDNPETIRKWHVEERGWSATGYHLIITRDGTIHTTDRNLAQVGAHCSGCNHLSIGICLTGRRKFTEEQFEALVIAVDSLMGVYDVDYDRVFPHNHFSDSKTCPNFDVHSVLSGTNKDYITGYC